MAEKKPQMEFTPWGLQDLPERTLSDMASRGMGAARMERVPRADGGEDIVMKHVDIRTGPMPTELMDALVQQNINIQRRAHQDNAERAREAYARARQRQAAVDARRLAADRRRTQREMSTVFCLAMLAGGLAAYVAYLAIDAVVDYLF